MTTRDLSSKVCFPHSGIAAKSFSPHIFVEFRYFAKEIIHSYSTDYDVEVMSKFQKFDIFLTSKMA